MNAMQPMTISDEPLKLSVKLNNEATDYTVDIMELHMLVKEVETQHNLQTQDGYIQPTREFLVALANRLSEDFSIAGATPTIAWQLWVKLSQVITDVKKNMLTMPASPSTTESTPSS